MNGRQQRNLHHGASRLANQLASLHGMIGHRLTSRHASQHGMIGHQLANQHGMNGHRIANQLANQRASLYHGANQLTNRLANQLTNQQTNRLPNKLTNQHGSREDPIMATSTASTESTPSRAIQSGTMKKAGINISGGKT